MKNAGRAPLQIFDRSLNTFSLIARNRMAAVHTRVIAVVKSVIFILIPGYLTASTACSRARWI